MNSLRFQGNFYGKQTLSDDKKWWKAFQLFLPKQDNTPWLENQIGRAQKKEGILIPGKLLVLSYINILKEINQMLNSAKTEKKKILPTTEKE